MIAVEDTGVDCEEAGRLLSETSHEERTPEQRAGISAHLAQCAACREKWQADFATHEIGDAIKSLRAEKSVKDKVLQQIQRQAAPAPGNAAKEEHTELKRLGGFELLGRLGKGGMGTVLKARQVSMNRLVALKILPRKLAQDEGFVKRFVREARSAAALHHPNIVQAHDVGLTEGYYYFAMEYVEGEGLDAVLLREGPLEPSRALALLKQATSALAHAHEKGIVHRDIKPSNLMVDSKGDVRVTDFGLAKHVEGDIAVTADGQVLGTPAYVSPEMASGKGAGPAADLYSLGATFFHLLAGRPPFEGQSFSEVLIKQVSEAPPPLASLAPRVDRRFCHIIDRLLRKKPEGRFPSAQALLEALNGLGELQSPTEATTGTLSDTERLRHQAAIEALQRRRTRKRRAVVLAALAACGLLALAIGLGSRDSRPQSRQEPVEVAKPASEAGTPTPAPVPQPDAAEAIASGLLRTAQEADAAGQPQTALRQLDLLEKGCASTQFAAANRAAIAELRAKAEAKLQPPVPATKEPPTPEPPTPTPVPKLQPPTPVPEPQDAEHLAKWTALRAEVTKLVEAGEFEKAAARLGQAKDIPLADIEARAAKLLEEIDQARRQAKDTALAPYQKDSDAVWALLKERKYDDAEKFLASLAAKVGAGLVPAPIGAPTRGAPTAADHLQADAEAVKLLREFWAAVEKGLQGMKGQPLTIGQASGTVTEVKDGLVRLKQGPVESGARISMLSAPQALRLAGLKDDPQSQLLRAVFLLAEGQDLKGVAEALAAAGKPGNAPPSVAIYGSRLDRLTLTAQEFVARQAAQKREAAAQRAWRDITLYAKGEVNKARAERLLDMLQRFEDEFAHTEALAAATKEIDVLRRQATEWAKIGKWEVLFDGKTLDNWKVVGLWHFNPPPGRPTRIEVDNGRIVFEAGDTAEAIVWTGDFPRSNYEVQVEAMKLGADGGLRGMVFPVGATRCEFCAGGWDGTIVGLSMVDDKWALGNATTKRMTFEQGRWYRVRLRVTDARVEAWVDGKQVVDLPRLGHTLTLDGGRNPIDPFGIWLQGCLRDIKLRRLAPQAKENDGK